MGFFDQISKTLTQGVDRAKFEAEKFQKTTRLQGEVNEFRRQSDAKLIELGQRAYELQRAGQINILSVAELASAVDKLRTALVIKEEELKRAQAEVFEEPLTTGTPAAASSQQVPISYEQPATPPPASPPPAASAPTAAPSAPSAAAATKFCNNCGFQMPGSAMFCPNCGTRTA